MNWWAIGLALMVAVWLVTVLWLAGYRRQAPRLEAQLAHLRRLQREAEDRAEALETIDRSFIEQAPAAMLLVRPDRTVSFFNRAAADLFGLKAESSGRPLIELVPDHDLARLVREALAGRTPESLELSPPGSHVVLLANVRPIISDHSFLLGAAVVLENLTEVRRLELARRDLIANVSHELRTPLAGMMALVETLESGAMVDPTAATGFLAKLHGELDRLGLLVRDVLELSRIESGRVQLALQPLDLANVVAEALDRVQVAATEAGIRLELTGGPPLHVLADPGRCEQVLTNLLQNAARFTPPGGSIAARWEVEGGEAVVHVRDTGVGIPPDDLPRIFERFYKVDRARVHGQGSGTGLGLAIVKHLVGAMAGRVGVSSQPGAGSDFWFSLPLLAAGEEVQNQVQDRRDRRAGGDGDQPRRDDVASHAPAHR